jgi:hypothetical protein
VNLPEILSIQSSRISSRDQRNLIDVNVAEVVVDLVEPGPLAVGMKVDVYFRYDNHDNKGNGASSDCNQAHR